MDEKKYELAKDVLKILLTSIGAALMLIGGILLIYGLTVLAQEPTIKVYNESIDGIGLTTTVTNPVWPAMLYASLACFGAGLLSLLITEITSIIKAKTESKLKQLDHKVQSELSLWDAKRTYAQDKKRD